MERVITKLARLTVVHVGGAFVLMGGWALFANWGHPMPKPLLAAAVQGVLSGTITYVLKRILDGLRVGLPHRQAWWLPPVVACSGSFCMLVAVHWAVATPELARTISVPFSVATTYAVIYNLIMWRNE